MVPRFARFLTLLLAAIQFAAPAVVSVADGAYSKTVREPVMHVESSGGDECTPPHAADCTVCRYLTDGRASADASTAACAVAEMSVAPIAATQLAAAFDRAPTRSRAPPAV